MPHTGLFNIKRKQRITQENGGEANLLDAESWLEPWRKVCRRIKTENKQKDVAGRDESVHRHRGLGKLTVICWHGKKL